MNDNDSIKSNNVMSKTCRFDQQVNSSFKEWKNTILEKVSESKNKTHWFI